MQVKNLVQHGNSKAIIIERSVLQAAGLDENCLFQIVVDSNSGITIQSVKPVNEDFDKATESIFKEYAELFKGLADK